MAGTTKKTVLTDENIDELISVLQRIIDALKSVKDKENSFATACKNRNLNWQKVRQHLLNIKRCNIDAAPIEMLFEDEMDNYEAFYGAVFGESQLMTVRAILPPDYVETVEYMLTNTALDEREVYVLRKRFGLNEDGEKWALSACGNEMGISKERTRQIEAKGMRKLRHPSRNRILQMGISRYKIRQNESKKEFYDELSQAEIKMLQEREMKLLAALENADKTLAKLWKKAFVAPEFENIRAEILQLSMWELDFSVRTANTLARGGIKTLEDILNLKKSEAKKIRSFGVSTEAELKSVLDAFLMKHLKMDLKEYHNIVHPENAHEYVL